MNRPWKDVNAIYQIYPRSFRDSDGDGVYDAGEPALTGVHGPGFARNLGGVGQSPTVAQVLNVARQIPVQ